MIGGPQRSNDPGRQPALRVLKIMVAALLIAALLNGGALKRNAEQMPFGGERDFWVSVWTPFAFVSKYTLLDQPRKMLDREFGNDTGGDLFELPVSVATPPPDDAPAGDPGDEDPTATLEPGDTASPPAGSTPSSKDPPGGLPDARPTPEEPLVRTPTAAEPLALWVGGDSMAQVLGESLVRIATDTGLFAAELDYRISTGLTRPDYFDWPGHFNDIITGEGPPEVMVVVFGGNDSQGLQTPDGEIFQPEDGAGWETEYARRVGGVMDLLRHDGRMVVWIGQPIARDAGYSARMAQLNRLYEQEATKRDWVIFVPMWDLFANESGAYEAYLPDDSGTVELMRQADGIHLSRAGGDRAANAILDAVYDEIGLAR